MSFKKNIAIFFIYISSFCILISLDLHQSSSSVNKSANRTFKFNNYDTKRKDLKEIEMTNFNMFNRCLKSERGNREYNINIELCNLRNLSNFSYYEPFLFYSSPERHHQFFRDNKTTSSGLYHKQPTSKNVKRMLLDSNFTKTSNSSIATKFLIRVFKNKTSRRNYAWEYYHQNASDPRIKLAIGVILPEMYKCPFYLDDHYPDTQVNLNEKLRNGLAEYPTKQIKITQAKGLGINLDFLNNDILIGDFPLKHKSVFMKADYKRKSPLVKKDKRYSHSDYHSIHLALYHISNYKTILKGYRLTIVSNISKCKAAEGTKVFFDMMFNPPPKLMLFGGACTSVTAPIAEASPFWNLIQVSYAEMHPKFSSRQTYPNFYRTVPSLNYFNFAGVQLLNTFNWTKVGTLFQDDPQYSLPHDDLLNKLDINNLKIAMSRSFNTPEKLREIIIELKNEDIRIFVAYFNETMAHYAFCYIYMESLYGAKYQWVLLGGMVDIWLKVDISPLPCSRDQMFEALEHMLRVDILPISTSETKTISGYTASEYLIQYNKMKGNSYSRFHGYAYDGIWAIALALEYVNAKLKRQNKEITLLNFNYDSQMWTELFKEALNATNFIGVTGLVKFYNGNRIGFLQINQVQDKKEMKIAEYDGIKGGISFTKGFNLSWAGKGPPIASPKIIYTTVHINNIMYIVISSLACIGITLAILFLAINIRYRKQRHIKMSSPLLNNVIIFGGVLAYISIILLGMDSLNAHKNSFSHLCMARVWILSLAFTLAFGAMFSKTWRVHAIFTNVKLNKKIIQDYKLFIIIGVLLSIDIFILTLWSIIDPFFKKSDTLPNKMTRINSDIEELFVIEHCTSHYLNIWMAILCAYKGVLMLGRPDMLQYQR
ncbi:gamma-aminobutyric acid type B receptor subunit 2-like isoform X2 [Gordionus sp. m RMFG-2023]|uniref:gamma-aminobutyric acid type B receptor subunit 2-like isoform X2 n=1 Tax=Gordionus sp. m RMFG-2023 TaxID=3053472 RepID=UPI0031FD4A2D